MPNYSWVENSLSCAVARYRDGIHRTPTRIFIGRSQQSKDFWAMMCDRKEALQLLSDLSLFNKLYGEEFCCDY